MTSGIDWIDQAQRLVEALRGASVADGSPSDGSPSDGPPTGTAAGGGHAPDCLWCPVCQAASVLRGERPEVSAALADLLTAAATALRTVAAAGQPEEPAQPSRPAGEPPAPVQQIDIA